MSNVGSVTQSHGVHQTGGQPVEGQSPAAKTGPGALGQGGILPTETGSQGASLAFATIFAGFALNRMSSSDIDVALMEVEQALASTRSEVSEAMVTGEAARQRGEIAAMAAMMVAVVAVLDKIANELSGFERFLMQIGFNFILADKIAEALGPAGVAAVQMMFGSLDNLAWAMSRRGGDWMDALMNRMESRIERAASSFINWSDGSDRAYARMVEQPIAREFGLMGAMLASSLPIRELRDLQENSWMNRMWMPQFQIRAMFDDVFNATFEGIRETLKAITEISDEFRDERTNHRQDEIRGITQEVRDFLALCFVLGGTTVADQASRGMAVAFALFAANNARSEIEGSFGRFTG